MIGIVLVSHFAGVIGSFMSSLSNNYDVAYDEDTLDVYNQMNEMNADIEDIQTKTDSISVESGVLDVIGGLFSDAYSVLLTTKNSFGIFSTMTNNAFDQADLGISGQFFKNALLAIILIIIFIKIIISAVVKRDL